jgi:hypothetical protein
MQSILNEAKNLRRTNSTQAKAQLKDAVALQPQAHSSTACGTNNYTSAAISSRTLP